ncbi:MAG TPA: adenylate/guanylate cyclase domain-containing protein, partial [Methylomirabilota bacterium]|nr:adenylate/guanylate cyclase domain-containing protein [Methylomirabilota bacterium]
GDLEWLQARGLELLMRWQGQRPPSGVVIVAIDDAAFESLRGVQPLPREYLARVVRGLKRAGAAVVGLDISLRTPTTPAADAALAQALLEWSDNGTSRVVVADLALADRGPLADPLLARAVVRGAPNVPADQDRVMRRVALRVRGAGAHLEPAFALAVVARLGGLDSVGLAQTVNPRGDGLLRAPVWRERAGLVAADAPPIDLRAEDLWRINFLGARGTFLVIPSDAVAALADPAVEFAEDNPLRGRIVLVGGTFSESRDFHRTPYGPMPGVEIHANIVHMLLTRSFIRPSGWAASLGLQLAAVFAAGLVLVMAQPLLGTALCLAGALAVGVPASYLAFSRGGYWIDFLLPVLVTAVLGLVAEGLARRRLRQAFTRYVSREVASSIVADPARLEGGRRQVSILLSDLRGFTTMSESMPPERMAARLTEYFDAMTAIIFARQGMVNDFVGDAIMAVFGAPVDDPDHARHAVESAAAMTRALEELNRRWDVEGQPPLRMGIGVHTGEVFAGNVGKEGKVKYAVVGDAVNLTARVEGLNKELGTAMLITEATRTAVGDLVEVNDRGLVSVKGRKEPVRVYEVVAVRAAPALEGLP